MNLESRTESLREVLEQANVDGFVVMNIHELDTANLEYLTGLRGRAALIITLDRKLLVTTPTEVGLLKEKSRDVEIVVGEHNIVKSIVSIINKLGMKNVGINTRRIWCYNYDYIATELQTTELVSLEEPIEHLRLRKDEEELERIEKACGITDEAFSHAMKLVRPGMAERDLAIEIEYFMRRAGAEGVAFPPIIATAENSAFPHAFPDTVPVHREIKDGSLLLIDIGARYEGYCSDMTRTVVVGSASKQQTALYKIVLEAQKRAIKLTREGSSAKVIDQAAREVVRGAGYGHRFVHGLGHGVGLENCEKPEIDETTELEVDTGMVFTIEPGIYIPKWGGIRIEDTVVVNETGCRVLTNSPKCELCQI